MCWCPQQGQGLFVGVEYLLDPVPQGLKGEVTSRHSQCDKMLLLVRVAAASAGGSMARGPKAHAQRSALATLAVLEGLLEAGPETAAIRHSSGPYIVRGVVSVSLPCIQTKKQNQRAMGHDGYSKVSILGVS